MEAFLTHLEKIFEFVLEKSTPDEMVDILYDRIRQMTEKNIIQRDIDNFIAYFRLMLSASRLTKKLKFESKLVRAFVDRTYTEFTKSAQEFRAQQLYDYLKAKIDPGVEMEGVHLERVEAALTSERKPALENIMEQVQVAMLLKWLQGPVRGKLSKDLQDYITFLGTTYGSSQRQLIPNVEWHRFGISKEDTDTIKKEYKSFENAITESIKAVKNARSKKLDYGRYEEQFRLVISSLDNLLKMSEKGTLNSVASFKDKVIVSAALIYIQDEFVRKDPQLRRIIQLIISLYYQFRDRH
jgi:hypothetical protein